MKPTKGRMVLYTLAEYDLDEEHKEMAGRTRPAVIVETWGNEKFAAFTMGSAVNLQVFTDSRNDGLPAMLWKTSVLFSDLPGRQGTWSWPPRSE
jgi:hypothetical protein